MKSSILGLQSQFGLVFLTSFLSIPLKSWSKMLPNNSRSEPNLFTVSLKKVIDLEHPLVKLAALIDWDAIRQEIEPVFCDRISLQT